MLSKLKQWWLINRHLAALTALGYVCFRESDYEGLRVNVLDFQRWVNYSGSLNDGAVPNHAKKMVESYARTIRFWLPIPAWPKES